MAPDVTVAGPAAVTPMDCCAPGNGTARPEGGHGSSPLGSGGLPRLGARVGQGETGTGYLGSAHGKASGTDPQDEGFLTLDGVYATVSAFETRKRTGGVPGAIVAGRPDGTPASRVGLRAAIGRQSAFEAAQAVAMTCGISPIS